MSLSDQKNAARKAAFARRAEAHKSERPDLVGDVLALAREHAVIAAYMPIRTEINPLPAMAALVADGHRVGIPVITANGQPLEFHEWAPDCAMVDGPFGAQVPQNPRPLTPSLVLAPLVAFDEHGTRLGYGGGFYDRTLERLRAVAPTAYWGLAYSAQKSTEPLPREATDIALAGIVTESGINQF